MWSIIGTKVAYFPKTYYHVRVLFENHQVSDASVAVSS